MEVVLHSAVFASALVLGIGLAATAYADDFEDCFDGGNGTTMCGRNAATAFGAAAGYVYRGPIGGAVGGFGGQAGFDAINRATDAFTDWYSGVHSSFHHEGETYIVNTPVENWRDGDDLK